MFDRKRILEKTIHFRFLAQSTQASKGRQVESEKNHFLIHVALRMFVKYLFFMCIKFLS